MQMSHKVGPIGKVITVTSAVLALGLLTLGITAAAEPHRPSPNALVWTALTLRNGWTNAPFGTRNAAAAIDGGGIVHLRGAIATVGTDPNPFRLPAAFRPSKAVFVAADLCNAATGRLEIDPGGNVFVQAADFTDAQCFTSLDGVSYGK